MTTFCFASSQITTWRRHDQHILVVERQVETNLILWEFRVLSSSDESNKVGFAQHLNRTQSGVEIYYY